MKHQATSHTEINKLTQKSTETFVDFPKCFFFENYIIKIIDKAYLCIVNKKNIWWQLITVILEECFCKMERNIMC